jgi:hypothetical protein
MSGGSQRGRMVETAPAVNSLAINVQESNPWQAQFANVHGDSLVIAGENIDHIATLIQHVQGVALQEVPDHDVMIEEDG